MGYDEEAGRSRRRQSRGRQTGKQNSREPLRGEQRYREAAQKNQEYGRRRTDGYREEYRHPEASRKHESSVRELNLITDSFSQNTKHPSKRQKAARQTAAAKMPNNGAYKTPDQKKAQKKKRKLFIILLELLILVSVLVFAAYSYLNKSMNMIQRLPWDPGDIKNVEISEEKQEQMKGYWTIAVFGVDSRNSSVGKGNNSDVNIICNINQDTGEIKLVSVFRDTYLNVSDKNSYNKINSAYLNGGPEQAVKALNKNLDLDIDDYVTFNWKAVADAINILGGIEVELSKAEFYYINAFITETVKATGIPSEPVKRAGLVHLDGVQAVAYGRLRLMDTDYARTERQRKVISLAFDKAKKADWATLNNIIQTVFPQVATSVNMTDVLGMGRDIGKLHIGDTMGFPSARSDADLGSKGACVIPQTLEINVREVHSFLFSDESYEPTETVKAISKKISSDTGRSKTKKTTDHADTDKGSVSKSTEETKAEDRTKESRNHGEASKGTIENETKESESYENMRPVRPGASQETDSLGNVINPETKESESGITKPGIGRPGETTQESIEKRPGSPESSEEIIPPRPGSGTTERETMSPPGSDTDTGVIIGPGSGGMGGNSNSENAPGSSQNAPGSGSGNVEFTGPMGP